VLTALGVLHMLPVLQRLGDAYGFLFVNFSHATMGDDKLVMAYNNRAMFKRLEIDHFFQRNRKSTTTSVAGLHVNWPSFKYDINK